MIPCVASVSVWFRSQKKNKERQGEKFSVLSARKLERDPKNERGGRGRGSFLLFFPTTSPLFYLPHFRAVFDSRSSFFAPKLHGNTCCAGYQYDDLFVK